MKPAAAIYLRVSKDDGSQTTDNQRPDVEQMAAGRGYVVAPEHVYIDEASGAKGADERPALAALLAAAARGRFRAVFVWRLDRLSRDDSFRGGAMLIGQLDSYNVAILSHQETWLDTSGFLRNALVQFAVSIAADERNKLIGRTHTGIRRARGQLAAKGKYWNERKGKWVTHIGVPPAAISAEARDRALALLSAGHTWRAIHAQLASEGMLRPYSGGKRDGRLPSHAALHRACTKGGSGTGPANPHGTGSAGAG